MITAFGSPLYYLPTTVSLILNTERHFISVAHAKNLRRLRREVKDDESNLHSPQKVLLDVTPLGSLRSSRGKCIRSKERIQFTPREQRPRRQPVEGGPINIFRLPPHAPAGPADGQAGPARLPNVSFSFARRLNRHKHD